MSTKKIILICTGILLIALALTLFIFMTEPTAKTESATKQMAMLVSVIPVEKRTHRPVFIATGTVSPVEDVVLSSQVEGRVVRRSPAFIPGGFVTAGTVLLQVDPSDYRNTLELRKSELLRARTDLDVEMGRQEVAKKDLALIGRDSLSPEEISLVLRQPQLNAVKANITAAEAAVDQAELQLARTTIRAPFDAQILSQEVTVGSRVSPGDDLGRLVGTDFYWVTLSLPLSKLQWLEFPDAVHEAGSQVRLQNTSAWSPEDFHTGYLSKLIGALDQQTRLARVLVKVPDPLSRTAAKKDKPALMIGSFVEAQLFGKPVPDIIRLSRDHVHKNDRVWVMEDGKLAVKEVTVLLRDAEHVYISGGLQEQDKVITTNLSTVTEGTPVRTQESDSIARAGETTPEN